LYLSESLLCNKPVFKEVLLGPLFKMFNFDIINYSFLLPKASREPNLKSTVVFVAQMGLVDTI
jgi:hypothetical protein